MDYEIEAIFFGLTYNTDLASDCTTIYIISLQSRQHKIFFLPSTYAKMSYHLTEVCFRIDIPMSCLFVYVHIKIGHHDFVPIFHFFLGKFIIWSLIYLKIQFWFPYYLIHEFSVSFFVILLFQSIIPKLNVYWPTLIATYCIFIKYWPSRITCLLDTNFVHLINVNFQ